MFILSLCDNSGLLRFFLILKIVIGIVFTIIPLIIMYRTYHELFTSTVTPEKIKERIPVLIKNTIAAILIFLLPTIFTYLFNNIVSVDTNKLLACYNEASLKNVNNLLEQEEAELAKQKKEEQEKLQQETQKKQEEEEKIKENIKNNLINGSNLPGKVEDYPLMGKNANGTMTNQLEVDGNNLTNAEKEKLNEYILSNVDKAGNDWGTRVATAGYSLIQGLNDYNLRLHYEKAGTGADGPNNIIGYETGCDGKHFCPNWGKHLTQSRIDYVNGRWDYVNDYSGVDCTGLVKWAIGTGCGYVGWDWQNVTGGQNDLSKAKSGDYLSRPGHVALVIKNLNNGTLLIGESTSGYNKIGTIFNTVSTNDQTYTLVSMQDWYKKNCSAQ